MTAGVLTAIYNILPFFRTDGYFALSDWVQIPNLDRKAQAYFFLPPSPLSLGTGKIEELEQEV